MDYIKWIRSKVGHDKIILNYAAGIIRNDQGQILMQQRGDSHLWGIIGGAMELSENPEDTLRREILEETGLRNISIEKFQGVYITPELRYPNGDLAQCIDLVYQVYTTEQVDLNFKNEETLALKWIDEPNIPPLFNHNQMVILTDYFQQKKRKS